MDNPIKELAADSGAAAERLASLPMVAGASVASVVGDDVTVGAAGVADHESGEPVTPATRFRVGSITKLLTASLVLQCVDDGLLALDDPVTSFFPDVPAASAAAVRNLIGHSSGIDAGDLFVDTGDDDDCRARYAALLRDAGSLFPPGATFSYCNAGFVIAGHIVERLRGRPWEDLVRALPGMDGASFVTGKEAANDLECARGHAGTIGGVTPLPRRIDDPMASRALAPAGGTLTTTATSLAHFVRAHLATPSTGVMRELQAPAPGGVIQMLGAGLGWMVWRNAAWSSVRIGGANPGQSGVIAADPASGTAVVVLTNSDVGVNAVSAVLDAAGPPPADVPPAPDDLTPYAGDYVSHIGVAVIEASNGHLLGHAGGLPPQRIVPIDRVTFSSSSGPVAFFDFDVDGRPRFVRWRMRVARRRG